MRLVRVERCFQSVFPGTSLHGGELRGGVATSLGGVLVANIARRGQAPPWRKITPGVLILVPPTQGRWGGPQSSLRLSQIGKLFRPSLLRPRRQLGLLGPSEGTEVLLAVINPTKETTPVTLTVQAEDLKPTAGAKAESLSVQGCRGLDAGS